MVVRPAAEGRSRCPKSAKKMALISSDLPRENSATNATTSLSWCSRSSKCWIDRSACASASSCSESHSCKLEILPESRRRQSLYASKRAAKSLGCMMPPPPPVVNLAGRRPDPALNRTLDRRRVAPRGSATAGNLARTAPKQGAASPLSRLSLAHRTVSGRTPSEAHGSNDRSAYAASLARSPINVILELKASRLAVAVEIVAQGAAAFGNGIVERCFHRVDQPCQTRQRQSTRSRGRADSRAEQRLVGVDIPDADNHPAIHEGELDRSGATSRRAEEVLRSELGRQRFRAQGGQQRMVANRPR